MPSLIKEQHFTKFICQEKHFKMIKIFNLNSKNFEKKLLSTKGRMKKTLKPQAINLTTK